MNLLANYPTKDFTIPEALLYAVIGFVLVIIVLIFLMALIKGLSLVVVKLSGERKGEAQKELPTPAAEGSLVAPGRSGEIKLFDVPDKEAAMVMAIVADQLKAPLATLNFISIKEVKDGKDQ